MKNKTTKKKDRTYIILKKAWEIQSKGLRSEGRCAGCGKTEGLSAGHLVHGGRGKPHDNIVDFNVLLPAQNIFCQCDYCNRFSPDGNGLLRQAFNEKYGERADELYWKIRAMKQEVWKPSEETAMLVLSLTVQKYGEE